MRKRLPLFFALLLLITVFVIVIRVMSGPDVIPVSRTVAAIISPAAALRLIADTATWNRWWPASSGKVAKGSYAFEGVTFGAPEFFYNAVHFSTLEAGLKSASRLTLIPTGPDSVLLNWTDSIPVRGNLIARWQAGRRAAARGYRISHLLGLLQRYLDDPLHVYGFRIIHETSRDSTLISVILRTPDSPGTAMIYQNLDALKTYIAAKRATIVNYPMLHIDGKPGDYVSMLAYAVDKALPDSGQFKFKRFLPWKMISAEVRGGEPTIRAGYRQFYQYVQDYGISVMANGFAFLITDRRKEPDSSRWVTRFSAPIP